jgi:hypothetical protein
MLAGVALKVVGVNAALALDAPTISAQQHATSNASNAREVVRVEACPALTKVV